MVNENIESDNKMRFEKANVVTELDDSIHRADEFI